MGAIISRLEAMFGAIPHPVLEVWGLFAYVLGFALAIAAFGGFTFRLGDGWGLGRERLAWNGRAFLCMPLTFVLVALTGYLGSFVVLVPGAQTLESLKDLAVYLCIVLFGYPALITVPFAYGLADLIEGVPPEFLYAWLPGYFINPAFFWLSYQLIGKNPDFRRARTWMFHLVFVVVFMALEPVMWGYICADEFTPEISYRAITSALFFTTGLTWIVAPFAMLAALPLARRLKLFWAEIPGHVRERAIGYRGWSWQAGGATSGGDAGPLGLPIRMVILAPFIALVLVMVGATAYVALKSAEEDAEKIARTLHRAATVNVKLRLDAYLAGRPTDQVDGRELGRFLDGLPIAQRGRVLVLSRSAALLAVTTARDQGVARLSIDSLRRGVDDLHDLATDVELSFVHVTQKPLSRETWIVRASPYRGPHGMSQDWILATAMPESYHLAGVREGHSRSAMVFTGALLLSLALAAALASAVTLPLRRLSRATLALARGDRTVRVASSRLEELSILGQAFNEMAARVQASEEEREALLRQRTQELQRSERQTQGILDNLVDGVVTIDDRAIIRGFSPAAERIFGRTAAEAIGQSIALLLPEGAQRDRELDAFVRTGKAPAAGRRVEIVGKRKDGTLFPMDLAVAEVSTDSERQYVNVVRDISDRKRVEEQLREAKESADAANRAKSSFLAAMSHEIRTPMNAILGFGQLMERDSQLNERDRERLEKIMVSSYHLLDLINNVLEMSKIEAGRTEAQLSDCDLPAAIDGVDAMVRARIESKGLDFIVHREPSLPRYVRTDAAKLRQILLNLLGNAAKFTHEGGIVLRADASVQGARAILTFSVTDTGVGIAPEELPRVFEPFTQTRSGVAAQTGTGLGAAISRDFARLLGGDLTVQSTPGLGTTFQLVLPVEVRAAAGASPPDVAETTVVGLPAGYPSPTILVVDDQDDNRHVLRDLLTHAGFEVVEARDGAAAIHAVEERKPALVFMDVKMPTMDGVEATRRLRETDAGKTLPIVLLSASALRTQQSDVMRTGADEFIVKPYRQETIWQALERHLSLRFVRRANASPGEPSLPLTHAEVAELGSAIVAELRQAVELGYLSRIRTILEHATGAPPRTVAGLIKLADQLEVQALLKLL